MKLIMSAAVILGALGAIWVFVVIPAEKRDHQRRLDLVRRKLDKRQSASPDDIHSEDGNTAGNN